MDLQPLGDRLIVEVLDEEETTVSGIVRFRGGAHSSLFNPAPNLAVTQEMQQQTVVFAASGGSTIRVNNASVIN